MHRARPLEFVPDGDPNKPKGSPSGTGFLTRLADLEPALELVEPKPDGAPDRVRHRRHTSATNRVDPMRKLRGDCSRAPDSPWSVANLKAGGLVHRSRLHVKGICPRQRRRGVSEPRRKNLRRALTLRSSDFRWLR